ncbi:FAD-dependent oxidoreductase [Bradyrhizobium sp. NP1]|uniref:FAD-dependent oxidoreductase n=1 Tax=Bradyrhizobium sp. NP1 TaxID=3049772 RepID=UPI0025A51E87|nr:FAD-dependent oxidoreductase [Bradyrhizobium sp. NP1]WJR81770.1 GMC oxidoreductase [Bradyrhizobium sp. NP1]
MYFSKLTSSQPIFDICVIGAGPVGLTVALECEAAGLSVLLVDAGTADSGKPVNSLGNVEIHDNARHASIDLVTRSGLGGTSALWGGRCVPFDDIDFDQRSHVPHSGWPIPHRDIKNWYRKAAFYLDCGADDFVSSKIDWNEMPDVSFHTVERLSSQPRLGQRFKTRLKTSQRLSLRLGFAVAGLDLDVDGTSVRTLKLESGRTDEALPRARNFVLACGGLQTTRLLLELQRQWPQRFGGNAGPLGRFYMGHLTGKIATLVLNDPADVRYFDYARDERGYWCRRRFTLPAATQIQHQLLNTVFWLGNPPFHDPSHANAAASSMFLAMALPVVGNRFSSTEFFAFHRGPPPFRYGKHLANVLRDPAKAVTGIAHAAIHLASSRNIKPFFFCNRRGRYALHYHSEQVPNPSSQVRLTHDPRQGTKLVVDFRYCDEEAESIVRAHEVLDDALRRSGRGHLEYWQPPQQRAADVLAQARDGYHQIGTARMNENQRLGVVDSNCRVHGLNNLYLAGSAVFPTSGQANPTFAAVALAARLAEHLRVRSAVGDTISA